MNLATALVDAAGSFGDRTALLQDGLRMDYAELERLSARFAALLKANGVGVADRVGLLLPNEPAFVGAYFGALRIGAIVVPLNFLLKPAEIRQRLTNAGARIIVASPQRHAELEEFPAQLTATLLDPASASSIGALDEIVPREEDDTAALMYTSGTTAGAKAAELTHGGLRYTARILADDVFRLIPDDVIFGSTPFAHILGQQGAMIPAILSGASIALVPRFDPETALEQMLATGTTVLLAVPAMCVALLRAADTASDLPRLKVTHAGGAPLPAETIRNMTDRFGCEVLEGYGLTETAGVAITCRPGEPQKVGSVGIPAPGVRLRVVDLVGAEVAAGEAGEVLLHTPAIMRGYWRNPEATAAAINAEGWFATGDMGRVDGEGYLFLVDRKKDVILRGGYTVYPREVEDALYEHPAVRETAVIAVPDERMGEEVVALVVPRDGVVADPAEIKAFVRERVAAYKYPRLVVVVADLPRSPTGKILKREIDRAPLRRALDAETGAGAASSS